MNLHYKCVKEFEGRFLCHAINHSLTIYSSPYYCLRFISSGKSICSVNCKNNITERKEPPMFIVCLKRKMFIVCLKRTEKKSKRSSVDF